MIPGFVILRVGIRVRFFFFVFIFFLAVRVDTTFQTSFRGNWPEVMLARPGALPDPVQHHS